ncbi:MAG TPA: M67 family metallopeptidase [Candidatus Acidoferrum sp.]|nr:M67 family metallopeptidase [Candidatus Acidoferrum sp.]
MPTAVRIARECLRAMENHARENSGVECCGLLFGSEGTITRAVAARNAAEYPSTSYEIAPEEIVRTLRAMREANLEMLGIYHSHPHSENAPSPSDIARAYYSEAVYFIFSPLAPREKTIRAFSIRGGRATELAIEIV